MQLYREPSPWGTLAVIGGIVAVVAIVLIVLGGRLLPAMYSVVDTGLRTV